MPLYQIAWKIFTRRPQRLVGVILALFFIFLAIFGPVIYTHLPQPNPGNLYAPPSWSDPLGTDYAGRDIWVEIALGARPVLTVAILAAIMTVMIGSVMGVTAGFVGGWLDAILMRLTDIFLTVPSVVLLVVLASLIRAGSPLIMAGILSITLWGGLARSIRSMVLSIRERSFVEASRGLAIPEWRIMFHDVLPNLVPYIVIHIMLAMTSAIYGETGLYFLGLAPFNNQSWGVMLNFATGQSGALYTLSSIMYVASPIIAIVLLQTSIILCLDGVNELVDPRLRTSVA